MVMQFLRLKDEQAVAQEAQDKRWKGKMYFTMVNDNIIAPVEGDFRAYNGLDQLEECEFSRGISCPLDHRIQVDSNIESEKAECTLISIDDKINQQQAFYTQLRLAMYDYVKASKMGMGEASMWLRVRELDRVIGTQKKNLSYVGSRAQSFREGQVLLEEARLKHEQEEIQEAQERKVRLDQASAKKKIEQTNTKHTNLKEENKMGPTLRSDVHKDIGPKDVKQEHSDFTFRYDLPHTVAAEPAAASSSATYDSVVTRDSPKGLKKEMKIDDKVISPPGRLPVVSGWAAWIENNAVSPSKPLSAKQSLQLNQFIKAEDADAQHYDDFIAEGVNSTSAKKQVKFDGEIKINAEPAILNNQAKFNLTNAVRDVPLSNSSTGSNSPSAQPKKVYVGKKWAKTYRGAVTSCDAPVWKEVTPEDIQAKIAKFKPTKEAPVSLNSHGVSNTKIHASPYNMSVSLKDAHSSARPTSKTDTKQDGPFCYACNEYGHADKYCTVPDVDSSGRPRDISLRGTGVFKQEATRQINEAREVCTLCHQRGHSAKWCPEIVLEADRVCIFCKKSDHTKDECWQAHPELKHQYLEKQRLAEEKANKKCDGCGRSDYHNRKYCHLFKPAVV